MEEWEALAGDKNAEPLPLPPGRSRTYIVQIPRDQIYRVPPPENALIVESHRKGNPKNKKNRCCKCFLIITFLVVIALGISGVIAFVLLPYNPKSPEFIISKIHANNLQSSDRVHAEYPQYPISVQYRNPNKKMEVRYGVGTMTLKYKGREIAKGKSPLLNQEAGKQSRVDETLNGTRRKMPSGLQKGLVDKNPKSMTLVFDIPIKVTSSLRNLKKDLAVTCDLKVNTLGKGTKILSQNCRNNF